MPVQKHNPHKSIHKAKIPQFDPVSHVAVARPVYSKEIQREQKARDALDAEWNRLAESGTWDLDKPQEAEWVRKMANKNRKTVHIGRVFEICVQKGSELPKGHKGQGPRDPEKTRGEGGRGQEEEPRERERKRGPR